MKDISLTYLLLEVGELNGEPFNFSQFIEESNDHIKCEFKTDRNDIVIVKFDLDLDHNLGWNVGYSINDKSDEEYNTDIKYLFRILKTIRDILYKFLEIYQPPLLTIMADSKSIKSFKQKEKLYFHIIKQHLPSNYTMERYQDLGVVILTKIKDRE